MCCLDWMDELVIKKERERESLAPLCVQLSCFLFALSPSLPLSLSLFSDHLPTLVSFCLFFLYTLMCFSLSLSLSPHDMDGVSLKGGGVLFRFTHTRSLYPFSLSLSLFAKKRVLVDMEVPRVCVSQNSLSLSLSLSTFPCSPLSPPPHLSLSLPCLFLCCDSVLVTCLFFSLLFLSLSLSFPLPLCTL